MAYPKSVSVTWKALSKAAAETGGGSASLPVVYHMGIYQLESVRLIAAAIQGYATKSPRGQAMVGPGESEMPQPCVSPKSEVRMGRT